MAAYISSYSDSYFHSKMMQRAILLAKKNLGSVAPNPMVGAVIVYQNKIIGEGFHQQYGEPHAEVNAFASVQPNDQALLPYSTMYVTLEPCAHFGKTPPCANLVVKNQIKRVFIGTLDPNPKVAGRGVKILEEAGVEVQIGLEEEKCKHLMRRFLTFHQKQRPYIILKWAETSNGYFAPASSEQKWISNGIAKKLSHRWRTEEAAILVGTNTAYIDNPQLTNRFWAGTNPLRLVIDQHLRLNQNLHLFDQSHPTIVYTSQKKEAKKNLSYQVLKFSNTIPLQILQHLYHSKINSLIVEGGKTLLQSFIELGLWDEARVFIGQNPWAEGIKAPKLPFTSNSSTESIGDNLLNIHFSPLLK